MEYKIVIGWDADGNVYRVLESEIDGLWLEASTREDLIAAISDAATAFLKQGPNSSGAVRIFEEVGDQGPFGQAA
jgi:predicted RNase H-like HicB family nuclease